MARTAPGRTGCDGVDESLRLAILICGPIASGKSSLAIAAARILERHGLRAATIDLDLIYETLEHTGGPKSDAAVWTRVRRAAGALTSALLDQGIDVVIAEGDLLDERERGELLSMVRPGVATRFVTLTVPLATALARVARDPTRGLSRDRAFLTRHYAEMAEALRTRPDGDLCLDTSEMSLEEASQSVVRWALGSPTVQ